MKTYGKMLKKVFGVATVCVAFGMTNLKADFEQDLYSVCGWFNVDPESNDMCRFLKAYQRLYWSFQRKVVVKVKGFQEACRKDDKDEVKSEKIPYWPTKSEFGVLSFRMNLLELAIEYSKKEVQESFEFDITFCRTCRFVFYRRMYELVEFCLQSVAGRFYPSELFNKQETELNEKTAYSIAWPFLKEKFLLSNGLENLQKEELQKLQNNLKTALLFCYSGPIGSTEARLKALEEKNAWDSLGLIYRLMWSVSFEHSRYLSTLANNVQRSMEQWLSELPEGISKEEFFKFSKDKKPEELLELNGKYVEQNKEVDLKIRSDLEYKELAVLKNEACDALKDISHKYEGNLNLAKQHDDLVLRADQALAEIALEMGSKNKYDEIKNEMKKNSDEAGKYWEETENLRPKVKRQREALISLVDRLNRMYSEKYSKLSVSKKDMQFVKFAIQVRRGDGILKAFFYRNTLLCNTARGFVAKKLENIKEKIKKTNSLQLTDDFEEEYDHLMLFGKKHRSSSLDKRQSKIRMEFEESFLINEESLNAGFIREDKEREREKSTGLKRTKKI